MEQILVTLGSSLGKPPKVAARETPRTSGGENTDSARGGSDLAAKARPREIEFDALTAALIGESEMARRVL
jgi:hypothetical protein